MFERYTEPARRTLFFARYEATTVGGAAIEPEHLLLGLLRGDKRLTRQLFASGNVSYTDVRRKILDHFGVVEHVPTSTEIPFSQLTDRILRRAAMEADSLRHSEIGAEHLLLGLLMEGSSFAAALLNKHGLSADAARQLIRSASRTPHDDAPHDRSVVAQVSALESVERVRLLLDELAGLHASLDPDNARGLVDQMRHHLDALKRYLTQV